MKRDVFFTHDCARDGSGVILRNAKLLAEPCSKTFFTKKINRQLDLKGNPQIIILNIYYLLFFEKMCIRFFELLGFYFDTSRLNLFWSIVFYLCGILLNTGSVLFVCLYFRKDWINFSKKTCSLIRCEVFKLVLFNFCNQFLTKILLHCSSLLF